MSYQPFRVSVSRVGDETTLTCSGELDLAVVDELRSSVERALETPPAALVLDLRGVEFLDSTGFRRLLLTAEQAAERRVELHIVPSDFVRRMFELLAPAQLATVPSASDAALALASARDGGRDPADSRLGRIDGAARPDRRATGVDNAVERPEEPAQLTVVLRFTPDGRGGCTCEVASTRPDGVTHGCRIDALDAPELLSEEVYGALAGLVAHADGEPQAPRGEIVHRGAPTFHPVARGAPGRP